MNVLIAVVSLVAVGAVLLVGALLLGAWVWEAARDLCRALSDDPAADAKRDSQEDMP